MKKMTKAKIRQEAASRLTMLENFDYEQLDLERLDQEYGNGSAEIVRLKMIALIRSLQ